MEALMPGGRKRYWNEQNITDALREFLDERGRLPTYEDCLHYCKAFRLPHMSAIMREHGSWANACIAAFGEARSKGHNSKDEDTERVIRSLDEGVTLTQLARARGMTGQALGRRVNRYQEAYGLPVVKRPSGRPRNRRTA